MTIEEEDNFNLDDELQNLSSEDWDNNVLECDMFEGDFGGHDDRCLMNKIVVARKSKTPCHFCELQTKPGTKIRIATYVFDGEIMNYRWCNDCCNHMAVYDHDGLEERFELATRQRDSNSY